MPVRSPISQAVAVRLDSVTLDLGSRRVLDDLSLTLPAGALTAIVGPNGCGKSTLVRLLTGFLYPTRGTADIFGRRLGRTDVHALRRLVKLVQPSPVHEPSAGATVRDVVLTGAFGTVDLYDRVADADRVRASMLIERLGLSAVADAPFAHASTGERMRTQLARSLMSRPGLLILDEPTSGLDLPARERLLATIDAILTDDDAPTILLVTHHVEELPAATTQVILMRDGRVCQAGPPGDVLTSATMTAAFDYPIEVTRGGDRFVARVRPGRAGRFE